MYKNLTSNTVSPTSCTLDKRQFLHSKLDEILHVWARGSGQGSFIFIIKDGSPDFEFCSKIDFTDVSPPKQEIQQNPQRSRGPARRERDRQRAAKHQAVCAARATAVSTAVTASPVSTFPGEGQQIGRAAGPTLPIPLQKGDVLPSLSNGATVCSSTLSTTTSTVRTSLVSTTCSMKPSTVCSTLSTPTVATSLLMISPRLSTTTSPSNLIGGTHHGGSDSENQYTDDSEDDPCKHCQRHLDMRSNPTGCPLCLYVYHKMCLPGHKCVSFSTL